MESSSEEGKFTINHILSNTIQNGVQVIYTTSIQFMQ